MGQFSKYINHRFPSLAMRLINKPTAKRRYKNSIEKMVVDGGVLPPSSNNSSVIFFSLHKAGSAIATQLLSRLHNDVGMKHINYDGYFSSCLPEGRDLYNSPPFLQNAYNNTGFFFGAHRNYINIPDIQRYKVLLQVRDPRDLLVSHYHGTIFINKIHQKKGVIAKKRAQKLGLDAHVLDLASRFKSVYENYIKNLDMSETCLLKFEDMVRNPDKWLSQISAHTCYSYSTESLNLCRNRLLERADGNKTSHHRKSNPGEYKNVLKQTTIDSLNHEFKEILSFFSYND